MVVSTYRVLGDVGGKVGEGRKLFGDVVHADSLFLVETADLGYPHVHSQRLLAAQEIVELCIVVWFTVGLHKIGVC